MDVLELLCCDRRNIRTMNTRAPVKPHAEASTLQSAVDPFFTRVLHSMTRLEEIL